MSDGVSDEVAIKAKSELNVAIAKYYNVLSPDEYVEGWVLLAHKLSPELEQEHLTTVTMLVKADQTGVTTRGIVEEAVDFLRTHRMPTGQP